MTVANGIKS